MRKIDEASVFSFQFASVLNSVCFTNEVSLVFTSHCFVSFRFVSSRLYALRLARPSALLTLIRKYEPIPLHSYDANNIILMANDAHISLMEGSAGVTETTLADTNSGAIVHTW